MNPMRKFRILIVCPEPGGLALLTSMLRSLGHLIEEAATDRLAVRLMERNPVNLVLASVDPGDADALELLSYVRRKHTGVPVILMFPRLHPDRAKEALRLGAMAVLKYPVPAAELRAAVLQALESWESRPRGSADLHAHGESWRQPAVPLGSDRATLHRINGHRGRRLQRPCTSALGAPVSCAAAPYASGCRFPPWAQARWADPRRRAGPNSQPGSST